MTGDPTGDRNGRYDTHSVPARIPTRTAADLPAVLTGSGMTTSSGGKGRGERARASPRRTAALLGKAHERRRAAAPRGAPQRAWLRWPTGLRHVRATRGSDTGLHADEGTPT